MNISTEIIIKRDDHRPTELWVSEDWLVDLFGEKLRYYLRTKGRNRYRSAGKSWRYKKIGGRYYYDYDRIPAGRRREMPEKSDIMAMANRAEKVDEAENMRKAIAELLKEGYKAYLKYYRGYDSIKKESLSKGLAVLEYLRAYVEDRGIDVKKMAFFKLAAEMVRVMNVPYLPKSHRRLKEKVLAVLRGESAADVVRPPREGNTNALMYEDMMPRKWAMTLRNSPRNYTNSYIVRKVQQMCDMNGRKRPSDSWFNGILSSHTTKFLTAAGRHDGGRKGLNYSMYIPFEGAMHAGDCWQADGTRVNLISHKAGDKNKSLYITAIRDVHSGDLLGMHLDTKEDRWAYINAMRMACAFTGHLPYELVIDRFPGHNTAEWTRIEDKMKEVGVKVTLTHTATGKGALERSFGTIQTVFMQDSDYYYGEGVMSRRDYAHRTSKYLYNMAKKAKKQGWDFDMAWREAVEIIERYRNTPLSYYSRKHRGVDQSPRELYEASEKPNVVEVDELDYIELFGLEKVVSIYRGILKTEIQRIVYKYVIDDFEILANHKKVLMRYDMEDLSEVHLWSEDGEHYLGKVNELRKIQIYGPDAEWNELAKQKARIKEIEERRQRALESETMDLDEVEALKGPFSNKDNVSSFEERWLEDRMGEWKDDGKPKLLRELVPVQKEEEEKDIRINVRDQY